MAYDVKYIGEKEEIKSYLDNREDRIESEFSSMITSGSNSNGKWIKFSDGTMEVRHSIVLNYVSSAYVQSKWDFPQTFIESPNITGGIRFGLASQNAPYLGGFGYWSKGGDHCYPRLYSTNLGFKTGDFVEVDVVATGRWK